MSARLGALAASSSLFGAGWWAHHYRQSICRPPELFYHIDSINATLVERCTNLRRDYEPTIWMTNRHFQTILGAALRTRPAVDLHRDIVECKDGGHLTLSWDMAADGDDKPILLIMPGLTGGANSKYIRHLIKSATKLGMRPCVFGYRGFDVNLKTPMVTTCANVSDVDDGIQCIRRKYPTAPIYSIGFSMGANMLVKYLGETARNDTPSLISGAVAVSNPFDFNRCAKSLSHWLNEWLYSRPLCMRIKWMIRSHEGNQRILSERVPKTAFEAQTIYDLDDNLSRHLYNISTVEEYYSTSSSLPFLQYVDCPILLLNSRDDPFLGGDIPKDECEANPNIMLAVTHRGGHVSWSTGVWPRSWMIDTCLEYLVALIDLHVHEKRLAEP